MKEAEMVYEIELLKGVPPKKRTKLSHDHPQSGWLEEGP